MEVELYILLVIVGLILGYIIGYFISSMKFKNQLNFYQESREKIKVNLKILKVKLKKL